MITENEKKQLEQKGISEEQLRGQLECFAKGFPYLELHAAASTGKGIFAPSEEEVQTYLRAWDGYTEEAHKVVKFVPASGAASRMFKDIFAFLDAGYDRPASDFEKTFFARLHDAAFFDDLNAACVRLHGKGIDALLEAGRYKDVAAAMLAPEGLNFGSLPKGLLKFHRYADGARTPLEEHLAEGALYAKNKDNDVYVHFTVSPEHRRLFEALVEEKADKYGEELHAGYHLGDTCDHIFRFLSQ